MHIFWRRTKGGQVFFSPIRNNTFLTTFTVFLTFLTFWVQYGSGGGVDYSGIENWMQIPFFRAWNVGARPFLRLKKLGQKLFWPIRFWTVEIPKTRPGDPVNFGLSLYEEKLKLLPIPGFCDTKVHSMIRYVQTKFQWEYFWTSSRIQVIFHRDAMQTLFLMKLENYRGWSDGRSSLISREKMIERWHDAGSQKSWNRLQTKQIVSSTKPRKIMERSLYFLITFSLFNFAYGSVSMFLKVVGIHMKTLTSVIRLYLYGSPSNVWKHTSAGRNIGNWSGNEKRWSGTKKWVDFRLIFR